MSELGQSVCEAIDFLDEFFKDISKLLTNVEQLMGNSDLVPYGDAGSFWYYSRAYYLPNQWLPRYFARMYVSENPSDSNAGRATELFAFFSAVLNAL